MARLRIDRHWSGRLVSEAPNSRPGVLTRATTSTQESLLLAWAALTGIPRSAGDLTR